MTRRTARLLAVGLVAASMTLVAVQPAAAYVDPPTFTFTPAHADEDPLTTYRAECPVTSQSVRIDESGTGTSGTPITLQGDRPLDGTGVWSADFYMESFYQRGSIANFTITCYDGPVVGGVVTGAVTGSTVAARTVTDVAAVLTAPATIAANAALTVTGNCGTSSNITGYTYYVYDNAFTQIGSAVTVPYTGPANYSITVGTPASLGLPAGETVRLQVFCNSVTPVAHNASVRNAAVAVSAATVTPATPAVTPTLAATGSDSVLPLVAGGGFLLLGAAVLILRRRREAVENAG